MKRFGEKLVTLRNRQGLTQWKIALMLGYTSCTYISDLERGKKNPSIELAIKMSEFFNVPVDKLVKDYLELDS